jgi:DNA-binding response OmpR family regulator
MMNSSAAQSSSQLKSKVLLISDEPVNAKIWSYTLNQLGLDVTLIGITEDAREVWFDKIPDIIIIEDFNDQVEELEICKQLRAETIVPILYLSAKTDELFVLDAYQAGADECIPFPITPRVFQAKVQAWLRRTMNMPVSMLDEVQAGGFRLIANKKQLCLPDGGVVRLTNLEARLLFLLMSHPDRTFNEEELIQRVWGDIYISGNRLLKNHLYRLRRKLEPEPANPRYLVSVGYNEYKFQV